MHTGTWFSQLVGEGVASFSLHPGENIPKNAMDAEDDDVKDCAFMVRVC